MYYATQVYCVLSIQLELSLQQDFGIPLIFPPPPVAPSLAGPSSAPQPPPAEGRISPPPSPKVHRRSGKSGSGIWNFLAKKTTEVIGKPLHRVTGMPTNVQPDVHGSAPSSTREAPPKPTHSPLSSHFPHRVSLDLVRTISTQMKLSASDRFVQSNDPKSVPGVLKPFEELVSRLRDPAVVLCTSPEVRIPPPSLLVRLAEREGSQLGQTTKSKSSDSASQSQLLKLTGDDRTGLSSIVSWSGALLKATDAAGIEAAVAEMTGTVAFGTHQSLTVLYAEHVPASDDPAVKDLVKQDKNAGGKGSKKDDKPTDDQADASGSQIEQESKPGSALTASTTETVTSSTSAATLSSTANGDQIEGSANQSVTKKLRTSKPCIVARWRTYRHFSRTEDQTLGQFVFNICSASERGDTCKEEGCGRPRAAHGIDWIHAAVKVVATVDSADANLDLNPDQVSSGDYDDIQMWSSCRECGSKTAKEKISEGSQ